MRRISLRRLALRGLVAAACTQAFSGAAWSQVTASWLTDTSANWTEPTAWSIQPLFPANDLPAVGDTYDAIIDAVGANYTVTLNSDITINSLLLNSPNATLHQQAGTLTLVNGGTIASGIYQLSGGTLAGGTLLIQSDLQWHGGAMAGPGRAIVASGAVLNATSFTSGRVLSRLLDNRGTFTLNSGSLLLANGTLLNNTGGVVNLGTSLFAGGTSLFSNLGTVNITSTGSFSPLAINAPMVNSGTINVLSGTLGIGSSGFTHNGGSVLRGPGTIDLGGSQTLSGGVVTFAGANMLLASGMISGPGRLQLTGNLGWHTGTIATGGGMTVAPGATLVAGSSGIVAQRTITGTVDNHGLIRLQSGTLALQNAILNNMPDGEIRLSLTNFGITSLVTQSGTASSTISNQGRIVVDDASTGSVIIAGSLVNTGTIVANSGTLSLGSFAGVGSIIHAAGSTLEGPGRIELGGTHLIAGPTTFAGTDIVLNSGSITGTGALLISGVFNWNTGSINAGSISAPMTIAASAVMNLPQTFSTRVLARSVSNSGTINILGGPLSINSGSSITNLPDGVINILAGATFSSSSGTSFFNQGVINFIPGAGSLLNSIGALINSGTLSANGGLLYFSSPAIVHSAGSTIEGTSLIELTGNRGFGTHLINGTTYFNGSNMQMLSSSGAIAGPGEIVLNGNLLWGGGSLSGTGTTTALMTINPTGLLDLSGTLTSSRWLNRTIVNSGIINFTAPTVGAATLNVGSLGVINNTPNGVISLLHGANLAGFGVSGPFLNNSGTIHVLAGVGSVQFASHAFNGGVITADTGTLIFTAGFGTLIHGGGSVINGPATIDFGAGTHLISGDLTLAGTNMMMSSASSRMTGTGPLTLSGNLDWRGATIDGTGGATITPTGHLSLGAMTGPRTLARPLSNFGLIDFNAGTLLLASTLTNRPSGVLNILSDPNFVGSGSSLLVNEGTINLANGSIAISVPFTNLGVVNVLGTATFTNISDAFTTAGRIFGTTYNQGTMSLAGSAVVDQVQGSGTLRVQANTHASAKHVRQEALLLSLNGSLQIEPDGTADGVSVVHSISLPNSGRLDLTNNGLVVDFAEGGDGVAELAEVRGAIADEVLTSSLGIGVKHLGSANNLLLGRSELLGYPVDASSILVKYTWTGDANLDGQVDITDLAALATSWQTAGVWTSGDFNYDGTVDISDLAALATNWQAGVSAPASHSFEQALAAVGLGGISVPEPAAIFFTLLCYIPTRRRRALRSPA